MRAPSVPNPAIPLNLSRLHVFLLGSLILSAVLFFLAFGSDLPDSELAVFSDKVLHVVFSMILCFLVRAFVPSRVSILLIVFAIGLSKEVFIDPSISGGYLLANWVGCMGGLLLL